MGECSRIAPPLLFSALDRGEWTISRPGCFTPRERAPDSHLKEGWLDPTAGVDAVEKKNLLPLPGIELWPSNP
jgi:hypothetical protein